MPKPRATGASPEPAFVESIEVVQGIQCVVITPDGRQAITGGFSGILQFDAVTGKRVREFQGFRGCVCWRVARSWDGKLLLAGFGDLSLKLWNGKTGQLLKDFPKQPGIVTAVNISADGTRAATGHPQKIAKVWDLKKRTELCVIKTKKSATWQVGLSPDGRTLLTAGSDKQVHVFDATTGEERTSMSGHSGWIDRLVWSPDGTRCASASRDKTARVWDPRKGKLLGVLEGHRKGVTSLTYSPDGAQLATVSGDRSVRLWSATSFAELARFDLEGDPPADAGFLGGGTHLAVATHSALKILKLA